MLFGGEIPKAKAFIALSSCTNSGKISKVMVKAMNLPSLVMYEPLATT